MHPVPAWLGRLGQVGAGQHVKHLAGMVHGTVSERSGGIRVQIEAGVQAQEPEQSGGLSVQVPIRPGEHRPHRRALVPAGFQRIQSVLRVSQFSGKVGEGHIWPTGREFGSYPQRQR